MKKFFLVLTLSGSTWAASIQSPQIFHSQLYDHTGQILGDHGQELELFEDVTGYFYVVGKPGPRDIPVWHDSPPLVYRPPVVVPPVVVPPVIVPCDPAPVPEPGSVFLVLAGVGALVVRRLI